MCYGMGYCTNNVHLCIEFLKLSNLFIYLKENLLNIYLTSFISIISNNDTTNELFITNEPYKQ